MSHHPSFGSVLKWDAAGGSSYTAIGQVQDISGPSISRGTVDVSDHDSASGYREYLPGLADGGDLTFTIGWDPATTPHKQAASGLIGNFELDGCTMTTWEYTLNLCAGTGTAIWTFTGFLTAFAPSAPVEGQNTAAVTVKISGKPLLTVT